MGWSALKSRANQKSANVAVASLTATNGGTATAAGATLFVAVMGTSFSSTTAVSCSDSAGNSYSLKKNTAFSSTDFLGIFEADNCNAVAANTGTWTVTCTATTNPADWQIMCFEADPDANIVGVFDNGGISNSSNSIASGSLKAAASIVFGFNYYRTSGGGTTNSPSSPWTNLTSYINAIGTSTLEGYPSYQDVSPASTSGYTFPGYTRTSTTITAEMSFCIVVRDGSASESVSTSVTPSDAITARTLAALRSLSTAPSISDLVTGAQSLFRTSQTNAGPATQLQTIAHNKSVSLTTSITPNNAVTAQQALTKTPQTSVQPTTTVGVSRKVAATTSISPSNLVVASAFRVSTFFPTVQFLVDWTNTGTFVDESAYVREIQIARGRAAVNDVFGAGTATVILRNESGRFGPYNPASPLYPNVIGARPFKLTTTFQGILYPEFVGYTNEYTVTEKLPKPEATISGIDAFDPMSRSKATIALQTGQTTDSIIRAILTAYGWTGLERLDVGRILPYYAQIGKTVLQALQEVSQNELGGAIFMGKDGAVVFQNAGHRAAQSSSYTLNGGIEDMNLGLRQSDLIDSVRITYGSYSLTTTTQNLYTGNINRQLPAQQYTTFTDYITSAQPSSIVTPVPYTDYTANDGTAYIPYTGGGNLDVTNSVWLETFSVSGGKFTATFYNSLPYTVQLSSFGIRGLGLVSVNNPPVYEVDVGSPQVENQAYELTVSFVTDINAIAAFATARANALGSQHPRPVITVVGRSASLMAFILGCDLSQRITLTDTAAPWLSQLNADFFIEHINLSIIPGQIPTAQLTLFDTSQGIPA